MQWRSELLEKFFIDSVLMESASFNTAKKSGVLNPFEVSNAVVICSYNFAARKDYEIRNIPWDLVIMDEAHRLRNVYKANNVMGKKLKAALRGRKKLLLTATPLQNNLMELYGLTGIIDEHIFGDAETFRDMYVSTTNDDIRNYNLKNRLQGVCQRTLRKQVTEHVRYTNRIAILQEYLPSKEEEKLYNFISDYLQADKLYALPEGQRTLITMVLRKLLASSSFAISGTLNSLINRLDGLLKGIENVLDMSDFDTFDELDDSDSDTGDDVLTAHLKRDCTGIIEERQRLNKFADLAKSIHHNAKGDNLLLALQKGFDKIEELGGARKAVIFTESRRTQEYLLRLLTDNGYEGNIVFLNGSNNDAISKKIYEDWKKRHQDDGKISGSKQADMKAAVVEEFRERASILIGTEAAAEGINLQFCSLLVNYDLPWNPQRIEQRIGRCHRYGQKNDVVVINFLNRKNAADVRVYELLSEKFSLFSGVFGSSDEVIGSIESGVDFEKRISEIYQKCKTSEEIQSEFDALQEELADHINAKMIEARHSILENFDEEVAARLKHCQSDTIASLDKFNRWIYYFFMIHGAERVEPLDKWRLRLMTPDGCERTYNLNWQDADEAGDIFLRREDPLYEAWLSKALSEELPPVHIKFKYGESTRRISFFDAHPGFHGVLSLDKLSYTGIDDEEHLVFSAITEVNSVVDNEMLNAMFELPAEIIGSCPLESEALVTMRQERIAMQQQQIENVNKQYFLDECAKLDAYSEDLKEGLQHSLKEMKKLISDKRKEFRASTNLPLEKMLALKDEINKLDEKCKKMQREIYMHEDEIEQQNQRLQDEIQKKLKGNCQIEHIMIISFEIV